MPPLRRWSRAALACGWLCFSCVQFQVPALRCPVWAAPWPKCTRPQRHYCLCRRSGNTVSEMMMETTYIDDDGDSHRKVLRPTFLLPDKANLICPFITKKTVNRFTESNRGIYIYVCIYIGQIWLCGFCVSVIIYYYVSWSDVVKTYIYFCHFDWC